MDSPKEIWEDVEEFFEGINIRRRQITGGDIEDDIVLKGKSIMFLMDEAYDLMDENLGKMYESIMGGVYDLGLGARENLDDVADEIKGLREHIEERRKRVKDEEDDYEESDLLEEIQEKFSGIMEKLRK
ncbi:MAG: hypothetical protein ACMUHM_03165 [Thermoplasmatota archaeon]